MKLKLFLLTVMTAVLVPICAYAETAGGVYGDNIRWSYSDGLLTFSGTGAVQDIKTPAEQQKLPWTKYIDEVTEIHFEDGITSVGKYLCYGMERLVRVELPSSLTQINDCAFMDTPIEEVVFPQGLREIGDSCFSKCEKLTSLELPDKLEKLGNGAFENCGVITEITIPASVREIGNGAFCGTGIKEAVIPNGAADIMGDNVFAYCESLEKTVIEKGNKSISVCMFSGCKRLKDVFA